MPVSTEESGRIYVDLIPNTGMKGITFGMHRNEVRMKIKEIYGITDFEARGKETDCYFRNSLQITYEEDETLTFIETAAPPPIYITIFGIKTWEMSGDMLLELLCEKASLDKEISEKACCPFFKETHITLWGLDEQYDRIGGQKVRKWGAIGIGDERYYNKICSIYRKM